jgi:uncharacterized protein (TIGR03435 family)
MNALFDHVWQSTAFAAGVAVAAFILRRHSPRLRYWLWLSASAKFLIPFSLILATGARIQLPPDTPSLHATTVQQISTYFSPALIPAPADASFPWTKLLTAVWIAGALFLLIRWAHRWIGIRRIVQTARKIDLKFPAPAFTSAAALEPGVFGILRPVLLLPQALRSDLTDEQFGAILTHESRHIQFRDNLTAALHMLVETLFWFHPLVWWIGARLIDERERDCDEAALRQGSRPADYARGIVSVCQSYTESALLCASGIGGADLKKRIRGIMTWRGSLPVSRSGQALLAVTALAVVSLPFVLGILRAQSLPPEPSLSYDVVSIRKSPPGSEHRPGPGMGPGPQGGLRTHDTPVLMLIAWAYHVQTYQIIDAPGWAATQNFDVIFTPDRAEAPVAGSSGSKSNLSDGSIDRDLIRLQAVLRDRFGLVLRSETREMPIYNLVQASGGARLTRHAASSGQSNSNVRVRGGQITGMNTTVERLASVLSELLERPVHDETRLTGQFDFKVLPEQDGALSESIFTALPEQLGLKLESAKGPVQVYVIEKLHPPTEN